LEITEFVFNFAQSGWVKQTNGQLKSQMIYNL